MYQIRINHRVNGQLETYITRITASSLNSAKLYAKALKQELNGHIVDVFAV